MEIALRTAAAIMGSREQAADVAQDVALDVLRSLHTLREPEAFDAWVRRIAVRRTLKAVRARRRPELPLALAGDIEAAGYDRDLLIAARAALAQALTTLPPRQRVALALKYVHDLTDVEIADALGCRRGTVHALLSRGRASLREVSALQALMEATR